jgi:heptose I phosphotransferase
MTSAGPKINTSTLDGVCINDACRQFLSENNLSSFDSFLSIPAEKTIKKVRDDRYTVSVKLLKGGRSVKAYLKRTSYSWFTNLLKTLRKFTRQRGSLVHEFLNLVKLREIGVPSITPVAAGKRTRGLHCDSFILTEDLGATSKLEDYVPKEFSQPFAEEQAHRKRLLLEAIAEITRGMHRGGVNHRDYYLCHLHILPDAQPWPQLFVIDLNRADRRKRVGLRWIVKDLAALNYSAPEFVFSRTDRMRFLKAYLETNRLDASGRRLAVKVIRKTRKIARHAVRSKAKDQRYMARTRQQAHCSGEDAS